MKYRIVLLPTLPQYTLDLADEPQRRHPTRGRLLAVQDAFEKTGHDMPLHRKRSHLEVGTSQRLTGPDGRPKQNSSKFSENLLKAFRRGQRNTKKHPARDASAPIKKLNHLPKAGIFSARNFASVYGQDWSLIRVIRPIGVTHSAISSLSHAFS